MTEIVLKDKSYFLPEKWDELTPDQFIFLLDLLNEYTQGKREARSVGINFGMYVLGIKKPRWITSQQQELFYENIAWLGEKTAFWWKVVYQNRDALNNIDPGLRKKLKRTLPEDLPNTPEVRVLRREKKWLEPDFNFSSNIIPTLKLSRAWASCRGYRFSVEDDLLSSSLTAGQFSDAMTIAGQYATGKNSELLNLLCSILYSGANYSFEKAKNKAPEFCLVKEHIKQAVFINFEGIKAFLTTKTKFAILFRQSDEKAPKITVGFNNTIYTLSKNGYGDTEKLMQLNLVTFLDLMLKELIDAVRSMKDIEMDLDKILKNTGLTLQQLQLIAP
ncbi:hypothetical protein DMA11_10335 [Marinilabiliaceae bacterium JC017]|nr:hypothetical protein DMA11_10335 [Marinilabiliaceae bacterium JC017]